MSEFEHKKESEKPKPDFQGKQHEHKACAILFEGTRAANSLDDFKQYDKKTVIRDRTVVRLKTMLDDCEMLTSHCYRLQIECINSIQIAKDYQEMVAMKMGIIPANNPQGYVLCPGCLQQAILSCEEVLISLKDIQEATKDYV